MPDNKPDPAAEHNGSGKIDYLRRDREFSFHSFDVLAEQVKSDGD
jgi:hypothetical protein